MKRLVLTLATAGVLAVPLGVAFADEGTPVDDGTVPVECEQNRERQHQGEAEHDGLQFRYGPGADGDHEAFGPDARIRNEIRVEDGNDEAPMIRDRDRVRIEESDKAVQQQDGAQIGLDDDVVIPGDGTGMTTDGTCQGACAGDLDQVRNPDSDRMAVQTNPTAPGPANSVGNGKG